MVAYKMAAVKITPPNDFPLGLIRSQTVVIHLILMLGTDGAPQRVVKDLCPTLYKRTLCVPRSKRSPPLLYRTYLLMLYKAKVADCSEVRTKHINAM
jgi:hypothetical protein